MVRWPSQPPVGNTLGKGYRSIEDILRLRVATKQVARFVLTRVTRQNSYSARQRRAVVKLFLATRFRSLAHAFSETKRMPSEQDRVSNSSYATEPRSMRSAGRQGPRWDTVGFTISCLANLAWAASVSLFPYSGQATRDLLLASALMSTPMSVIGITLCTAALRKSRTNVAKWGLILGILGLLLTYPAFGYVMHEWQLL